VHLAGLTRLRQLDLRFTKVTDDGVETLAKMKDLRSLLLTGSAMKKEGVAKLEKALPACIVWGP
jgi:hypothetical protein